MFVVVDSHTRCLAVTYKNQKNSFSTQAAARAAATRMNKMHESTGRFEVLDITQYLAQVPMIEVINLQSGLPVLIRADTPWHCRPDSETFWSA